MEIGIAVNLFKAQIESSCPGSIVVIDHQMEEKKNQIQEILLCLETMH